eukprot:13498912-Alexandrium_andersonii.AAC.1
MSPQSSPVLVSAVFWWALLPCCAAHGGLVRDAWCVRCTSVNRPSGDVIVQGQSAYHIRWLQLSSPSWLSVWVCECGRLEFSRSSGKMLSQV